jgi:hypothetical protein
LSQAYQMKESPSAYGGIAAVLVLGLGLLIVGLSLPPERHEQAVAMRWMGAVGLALGLVVMASCLPACQRLAVRHKLPPS